MNKTMSSKWNERLVTRFLKQYKQHPCLWNPYHQDYYNCKEKNEALQTIIDDLGTPGFTVTDYLHQIRIIREKYKREQTRTIKGLQSQKKYKSPFPWYNIVADMLTKVINDEEKANSETVLSDGQPDKPVLKFLSSDNVRDSQRKEAKSLRVRPCTDSTCEDVARRSKSLEKSARIKRTTKSEKADETRLKVKYVPCPQARRTEGAAKDQEEDVLLSYKPTRDTESRGKGSTVPYTLIDPTSNDLARETRRNDGAGFLRCPLCGWEDVKYKGIEENEEEPVQEWRNSVPCSNYNRDPFRAGYSMCTGCDGGLRNSGDYEILRDLTKQVPCPSLESKYDKASAESRRESYRSPIRPAVPLKKDIDVEVQCEEEVKEAPKGEVSVPGPDQTQIIRLDPGVAKKFQGGTIEACTRLKIILLDSKGNAGGNVFVEDSASHNTQGVQCKRSGSSKETQLSPGDILKSKRNEASVNTMNYVEPEVQDTVCVSRGMRRCISLQTLNQIDENGKDGEDRMRDPIRSMESKEVEANIVDQVSKGIQSVGCVSRGNVVHSSSFEKMKDAGTTPSIHEVHSSVCISPENLRRDKTNFVPSVGEEQCTSLIRAKSHGSIKHSVLQEDMKETMERGTRHYESPCKIDTCPRNLLQIVKEDPTVALMVQQLLTRILSRKSEHGTQSTKSSKTCNVQTDQEYKCNTKENCTLDVVEMVNKIKEHAIKTLGLSLESVSKEKVKEFSGAVDKSTTSQEVEGKQAFAEAEGYDTSTYELSMTQESDLTPILQSTTVEEDKTLRTSKDETVLLQEAKKFPVVDKEAFTYTERRDIGTDGSLSQLPVRDIGTQSGSKLVNDSVSSAKCEKMKRSRVSVGTQKRDPILVRVIKCNEGQSIVKSDKETLTVGTSSDFERKYTDKRIETCGRSTCMPYTVCRQPKRENFEFALKKDCDNHVDRIKAFKNFTCDKNCKDKAYCESDWTDVTNIDPFRSLNNSKIPLCMRSRRCTYTRNK